MTILQTTMASGTSAISPMPSQGLRAGALTVVLMVACLTGSATASTYNVLMPEERTSSGPMPADQLDPLPPETTAEAILEVRRRSGLTWAELRGVFDVSRRSVHNWASGEVVSAKHERHIRQVLAAMRHLDRGDSQQTRAVLLTPDEEGVTVLDLLTDGDIEDALARVEGRPQADSRRATLSRVAREARQRPSAVALLDSMDRPPAAATGHVRVSRRPRVPKA